jgi:predicted MFS family arabinose efflux permease
MKSYFKTYINNFQGFSKEIWVLTLITYINRTGAMVMPFLTKYLHEEFSFSLGEVGWMLVSIGCGALLGSWLGGKLTDKVGFYTIMLASLFLTGFGIITLMFLYDFVELCVGLFLITAIADMYKPAMYVAVSNFSNKQNRTRALSLVRLAVNLGIVSGPVFAGLLIQKNNYDYLFWIDGLTCIIAISIFMLLIDERRINRVRKIVKKKKKREKLGSKSLSTDKNFIIFLCASFLTSVLFFQLFTTIPVYNTEKLKLNELEIGMLISLNGLLIFLLEMPLIGYLERKSYETTKIILVGSVFMASGFFCLMFSKSIFILVISISLITLGQILLFSFSNAFAFSRAINGHEGRYMAMYTMCFSAAQILSAKMGFAVIESFSYVSNWFFMGMIGIVGIFLYYKLDKNIRFEAVLKQQKLANAN